MDGRSDSPGMPASPKALDTEPAAEVVPAQDSQPGQRTIGIALLDH
jgi:hypothetical protein